ncbi:hypothetical protein ABKV19_002501, partial [Rosa sericea]
MKRQGEDLASEEPETKRVRRIKDLKLIMSIPPKKPVMLHSEFTDLIDDIIMDEQEILIDWHRRYIWCSESCITELLILIIE